LQAILEIFSPYFRYQQNLACLERQGFSEFMVWLDLVIYNILSLPLLPIAFPYYFCINYFFLEHHAIFTLPLLQA
jgi:hypothetical protein